MSGKDELTPNCTLVELKYYIVIDDIDDDDSKLYLSGIEILNYDS